MQVAISPAVPNAAPTAIVARLHTIAITSPQVPGMRPEGMGRCGSLIASTWRSNQSFTAWLPAQDNGPVNAMPRANSHHFPCMLVPVLTTPQAKAHIGGNQVTGFSNSRTAPALGMRR